MTTTHTKQTQAEDLLLIARWKGEIHTAARAIQAGHYEEGLICLFTLVKAMENLEKKTAMAAKREGGTT